MNTNQSIRLVGRLNEDEFEKILKVFGVSPDQQMQNISLTSLRGIAQSAFTIGFNRDVMKTTLQQKEEVKCDESQD